MKKLLFVCLGNICRSPLAEGIFIHLLKEKGLLARFEIDSAGTIGYHCGQRADSRALELARRHGVDLPSISRPIEAEDFERFDLLLAMDRSNRRDLLELCPEPLRHKVKLMREYDEGENRGLDVPDPYYGGPEGFQKVYDMLLTCCKNLLAELEPDLAKAPAGPSPSAS